MLVGPCEVESRGEGSFRAPRREDGLAELVRQSGLAAALFDLDSGQLVAASPELQRILQLGELDCQALLPWNREHLALLRDHVLHGLEYGVEIMDEDGINRERQVAIRTAPGSSRSALVVVSSPGPPQMAEALTPPVPLRAETVSFGIVGEDLHVRSISGDVRQLLGYEADQLAGHPFLELFEDASLPHLMLALGWSIEAAHPVSVQVEAKTRSGSPVPLHLTLVPANGASAEVTFAMRPVSSVHRDEDTARVAELEHHLWNIGLEVESAGIAPQIGQAPTLHQVPELASLSSRQREVLTRILDGERVRTIANAMYLSPSTIRNHLSAIFSKFGVRSQAELLELFRPRPDR